MNEIKAEAELDFLQNKEESVSRNSVLSLAVLVEKCLKQNSLSVSEGRQPRQTRQGCRTNGPRLWVGEEAAWCLQACASPCGLGGRVPRPHTGQGRSRSPFTVEEESNSCWVRSALGPLIFHKPFLFLKKFQFGFCPV